MLFDLEDYATSRIISSRGSDWPLRTADQIRWDDPYDTFRDTRNAYINSINEYYLAATSLSTTTERQQLDIDYLAYLDSLVALNRSAGIFWPALISLPIKGDLQEGEKFNLQWVSVDDTTTGIDFWFPNEYYNPNWNNGISGKYVAVSDVNGDYTYSTLTQAIYDDYKNALVTLQSKVKALMLHGEGQSVFQEWVAPEIPVWAEYPEVSGYVRGTNSLSIKDAVVRLTDAEGITHDVVTDSKGYYVFTKEFIYNNVSLGATGSTFDLNINLLPTKTDGTVLYSTTSKYQNSFFGAVNNRSMNWPQRIVMNKPARRNFKIEFIPDYSNFPSFSGYVKDAAGNPIKDALVVIKDQYSGNAIGTYNKPNGQNGWNFKYNDFGVDRTILTDENGFYEYTSQMVGEWFHKYGFTQLGIPTTILTEPTRTFESMNRWFISNEFLVYLIAYKQDANSTSINWGDGTPIYDNNDYAASRFEYALSNAYQQFYYRDIEMGQNYVFNVDVVPAVGDEVMADKIKITCTPGSRNLSAQIKTTTGYCKFVFSNGVSVVKDEWPYFDYNQYGYDTTMFSEEFYVYSCDSEGRALGYITKVQFGDTEFSNISNIDFSETEHLAYLEIRGLHSSNLDLSGLKKLNRLYLADSKYLESVTGLQDSKYLSRVDLENTNRLTNFTLENMDWLTDISVIGTALSSFDISTCGKKASYDSVPRGYIQVQLHGMEELQSVNFGFIGHKPYSESSDSNVSLSLYDCIKLLVDDVDLLLQQFVDSGKGVYLNTDKARSSDSDAAYDTLIGRNSNLSFGSEYFESNEEKKSVIMYIDSSFGPDSNNSQKSLYLNGNIQTTTGYFRLKSWFDNGGPGDYNIYNNGQFDRYINVEFDDTFESRPVEIYSTDQYGRPSGSITQILLNNNNNNDFRNVVSLDLSQATELNHFEIRQSNIDSLDLTSNNLLQELHILNCGKLTTIDVTGLTSLYNLELNNLGSLTTVDGFDTLSDLFGFFIDNCGELEFLSLESFTSLHTLYLSRVFKYDSTHVDIMLQQLDASGSIPDENGGCTFDVYMARTYDSDTAYDSLISKGWNIYLGSEFFPPYTPPVKGYITLDWDGSNQRYFSFATLDTTNNYFMVKDPSGYTEVNRNNFYTDKGVLEFWPVNSFGRSGGSITGIFVDNQDITSVDLSNHTSLTALNLRYTQITTIDVSSLTNLIWLQLHWNSLITSIVGLELLSKLQYLNIRENSKLANVDTSGLESLKDLRLCNNSSLTDIDITTIGSKEITGLSFDNTFVSNSLSQNFSHENIVELPDGKFMVSGYGANIIRLNSDGTIDDTFATILIDSTTNGNAYVNTMEVQADGKVLVGGEFDIIGGVTMSTIARINTDGTIDETFTAGNLLSGCAWDGTNFAGQKYMTTIKVQPDGKILIGGFFTVTSVNMYGLVRLNSDGTIDSTFVDGLSLPTGDINGFARLGGAYEDPRVIELQSDGKILVGGSQWNGWFLENSIDTDGNPITTPIYRLNSDGTLDTTFDPNNNLSAAFYSNNNYAYINSILVDSTGKILVGGQFGKFGSLSVYNLVRLNSDGTLDNSFTHLFDSLNNPLVPDFINRKSLLSIGDKIFVGAYGRCLIIDENDNLSEYIQLNGGQWYNQVTCAIFTSNNKLVLTGGFNGSVILHPTEQVNDNTYGMVILDYDTYNFKSLQYLEIYYQDFVTPKHLDIHDNIKTIDFNYFRTFTSADLDVLLSELDANGKFNGNVYTGYVARTEASDVAYNNLVNKGWNLGLGSYFIGPNEEPTIAYFNYEETSVNESINLVVTSNTNYFVVKYPDGSKETRNNGWIYWDFDSSIPASERVIEIYGADQFGRPTDSIVGIDGLDECSSINVNALKYLEQISMDQNNRITNLNLDGCSNLINIYANRCSLLETISIVGCTASKNEIYLNSCPQFDIDSFLIQLDQTGSLPMYSGSSGVRADEDWGGGFTPARTSISNDAAESLTSKGFVLRVVEPAGNTLIFDILSINQYCNIAFSTSTGYYKILHNVVNGVAQDGEVFLSNAKYNSATDYNFAWSSTNFNYIGKMHVYSCTADGTPSGEIRSYFFDTNQPGGFYINPNQLSKIKVFDTYLLYNYNNLQQQITDLNYVINNINIKSLIFRGDWIEGNFDLSNLNLDYLSIEGYVNLNNATITLPNQLNVISLSSLNSNINSILSNLPETLTKLNLHSCPVTEMTSLTLPNLKQINIVSTVIDGIPTSYNLTDLSISNINSSPTTPTFDLDLKSSTSLKNLNINNVYNISSLDITGLQLDNINLNYVGGSDIMNPGNVGYNGVPLELIYGDVLDTRYFYSTYVVYSTIHLNTLSQMAMDTELNFGNRIESIGIAGVDTTMNSISISSNRLDRIGAITIQGSYGYGGIDLDTSGIVGGIWNLYLNYFRLKSFNSSPYSLNMNTINGIQSISIGSGTYNLSMFNPGWRESDLTQIDLSNAVSLSLFGISGINYVAALDFTNCSNISDISISNTYLDTTPYSGTRNNLASVTGLDDKNYLNSLHIRNSQALTSFSLHNANQNRQLSLALWDLPALQTLNLSNSTVITSLTLFRLPSITNIDLSTLTRINALSCHYNTLLTTLTIGSLSSGFAVSAHDNPVLNSVIFTNEPNGLYNLSLYNNPSFTATTVNNILSSFANNNRWGGYLRMTNLNLRSTTGAPATGYNRIANSLHWSIVNN